ncbi:FUSC family protein, partial [Catellatospora methionotrophica]|uniref:FUSC family protein n=1 Tax=Catellatospora methionotrophica TaxID=121620 RepID=UPI0033D2A560
LGLGIVAGSLLSSRPVLAVAAVFAAAVLAAAAAARHRWGVLLLNLVAPAVAIGLSVAQPRQALTLAVIIVLGSLWGWALALLWPERPAPATLPPLPFPDTVTALRYGGLLGIAAAIAAASSLALSLPHPGWAAAAVLLVMRPDLTLTTARSWGRALATVAGAGTAYAVLGWYPAPWLIAVIAGGYLVAAVGISNARRYAIPLPTAFLVLTLLLYHSASQAEIQSTFLLRIAQNLYGVTLALLFGAVLWPWSLRRARQ